MTAPLVALDLFAGTGWGVACAILGIEEHGVELMPEAVAVREANGMSTLYNDVWHGLEHALAVPAYDILIASPPCQTFSMAGNGAGRKALDEVVGLIDSKAYLDVANLRAFGEAHDMRTALVLTPLAHVARDIPTYVVLEQVPQVLPVWERMAEELRGWGYSVVTGVLNAEQYGVPQTRKRAILIARADGIEARMPTPTHSRYYPNDKTKQDPGVLPWVSMAEALGWGMTARPYLTLAGGGPNGGGHTGAQDPAMVGGTGARRALLGERESGRWVEGTPFNEGAPLKVRTSMGEPKVDGRNGTHELDPHERPAHTVTTKVDSWTVEPGDGVVFQGHQKPDSKGTSDEPDAYQTREVDRPAPTLSSGSRSAQWLGRFNDQSGTAFDPEWPEKRPALTVATRDIVPNPGHNKSRHDEATKSRHDEATKSRHDGVRVTVAEAAALQTYPATFDWVPMIANRYGKLAPMSKTKAFLQIGNAVPPLLARHVLATILDTRG